jgi:hypothetical protein
MSDDVPTTAEIVKATAEGTAAGVIGALLEPVRAFFGNLLGASVEEFGGWGGDVIAFKRWKSRVRMLQEAEAMVGAAGLTAHEVPFRVLAPILESGGDEDIPEMQGLWASLLANAATRPDAVPVAYPQILRQLEPVEARALRFLVGPLGNGNPFRGEPGVLRHKVKGLTEANIDNLLRLELARTHIITGTYGGSPPPTIRNTALGLALVEACRPPVGGKLGS